MSVERNQARQDRQQRTRALLYGVKQNVDIHPALHSFTYSILPFLSIESLTFNIAFGAQVEAKRNQIRTEPHRSDEAMKLDVISFVGQNAAYTARERGIDNESAVTYLNRIVHKGYELADSFMDKDKSVEAVLQDVDAVAEFFETLLSDS